jgi:hypothetical protein
LLRLLFCLLAATSGAHAANIDVLPPSAGSSAVVTIGGAFEDDDIEQFRTKTEGISKAIIVLASDGGNLAAGIEIGTMIRVKGYFSLVPDNFRCASTCALAWLGGTQRFMRARRKSDFMLRLSKRTAFLRLLRSETHWWART